jgi:hypothetical protein
MAVRLSDRLPFTKELLELLGKMKHPMTSREIETSTLGLVA